MIRLRSKLTADEQGIAIVELALIAPILAVLMIGVVDLSSAFSRKLSLEQGAQRAIEKIMQTTGDSTVGDTLKTEAVCQVNGMNANGTCKTSPITVANVAVTYTLECTSGGATTTENRDDPDVFDLLVCATGATAAKYVKVQVTDRYTPMFPLHFSALHSDGTYHLTAIAGMRTQ